jgi:archaemetzincin
MMRRFVMLLALVSLIPWAPPASAAAAADDQWLPLGFAKLLPLHLTIAKPGPGDWLAEHHEARQTYRQYVNSGPVRAGVRRTIYVQPLGDMTPSQQRIVALAAECLKAYYQLPAKLLGRRSLSSVPRSARRRADDLHDEQILTSYLRNVLLKPRLPKDAAALIGFTAEDLWPGQGWNYVFGEASLSDRVGVWSIHRFGDPESGDDAFRRCLRRTLRTATHETGHMFSLPHCVLCQCNMCGSNSLDEADRQPLEMCPHCLAKLCYATGARPAKRFQELIEFYKANGLTAEQEFCEKSLAAWNSPGNSPAGGAADGE